jgi:cell division protein FtsB
MKFLLIVHSIILLLLLASLWIGHGSYPEIWKLEQDIATQKQTNEAQASENRHIRAEVDDARVGHAEVEERARSELGMIKKGETFFEIILKPKPKKKTEPNVSQVLSEPK